MTFLSALEVFFGLTFNRLIVKLIKFLWVNAKNINARAAPKELKKKLKNRKWTPNVNEEIFDEMNES